MNAAQHLQTLEHEVLFKRARYERAQITGHDVVGAKAAYDIAQRALVAYLAAPAARMQALVLRDVHAEVRAASRLTMVRTIEPTNEGEG